ncbi:BTB/POZ domain-containing protein At3g19850 isoform X3 [Quercus suber]|uniref:BTB/POZ domain-containing protein At3g19850 isoform X3 n=1 Tax=Quercus suber TaxID=58331 RepID=UPI000CE1ACFF|nr:BTB/POZ domain-containing protein At3g19850 isoform X2 [Quercus suber]POF14734.1 btb/poz domain-containing protein [Quercus suber]
MPEFYDLQIHINGEQKFFLNEKIVSKYSARLKKMIDQEKRRTKTKKLGIEIDDFPGVFLGMTEKVSTCNLLQQTETFLAGMFYWSWIDILVCLKSCFPIFAHADSSGLVQKLISALLLKIAQNSDTNFITSSSSSSSSPETASGYRLSSSSKSTPDLIKSSSSSKAWWFEDLAVLPPNIIEKVIQSLGAYGPDNNSLILTRFLLHYLKTAAQSKAINQLYSKCEYGGLADTAIHGVVTVGKEAFSCRGLLWILRIVSGFGPNKDYKVGLEKLIGGMLDQATLDDLLVSGHDRAVYDVNLVLRLIRAFVNSDGISIHKMKKVGRLIDKYLGEISPDQNLKISKFLGVAESLPDSARDRFDGVYRAVDIYIQSHVSLSIEERSRLCGCLNYEKLSLAVCKELAKNPRIPPRIAVQALISQQSKVPKELDYCYNLSTSSTTQMVLYDDGENFLEENEDMRQNLTRMQWRVVELEKVCREMKGHMSKLVRHNVPTIPSHNRTLPKLC